MRIYDTGGINNKTTELQKQWDQKRKPKLKGSRE